MLISAAIRSPLPKLRPSKTSLGLICPGNSWKLPHTNQQQSWHNGVQLRTFCENQATKDNKFFSGWISLVGFKKGLRKVSVTWTLCMRNQLQFVSVLVLRLWVFPLFGITNNGSGNLHLECCMLSLFFVSSLANEAENSCANAWKLPKNYGNNWKDAKYTWKYFNSLMTAWQRVANETSS